MAAMKADRNIVPDSERREIAASLARRDNHDGRRSVSGRGAPTEFEMAGFWSEPSHAKVISSSPANGEHLKAGRFKVKLGAPIAAAVH